MSISSEAEEGSSQESWQPPARLHRNREFNLLWLAQTVSGLGDMFGLLAMPMLVLQATGSVAAMGRVTAAYGVGQFLACLLCGALVDRADRRRLMLWCDIGRFVGYGGVPLVWAFAGPQMWLLYAVTLGGAFLGATFQIASTTAVVGLVKKEQLTDANGRLQASYGFTSLVGPLLAGLVSMRFGPEVAVGMDGFSFIVSALFLCLVSKRAFSRRVPELMEDAVPHSTGFVAGTRFVLRHPALKWLLVFSVWLNMVAAVGIDLFVYRLQHEMSENQGTVGVVFAVASLGSVIGALMAPPGRRRYGFPLIYLGSVVLQGVALACVGVSGSAIMLAVFAALYSAGQMASRINSIAIRQALIPQAMLGQVTAVFWSLSVAPAPLGVVFATSIAGDFGTAVVCVGLGAVLVLLALLGVATPLRGLDGDVGERAPRAADEAADESQSP